MQKQMEKTLFTALTVSIATSILSISMTASRMAWDASGSLSWEMSFLTVCSSCWRRSRSPGSFRVDLRLGRIRQSRRRMFATGSYTRDGYRCHIKILVHVIFDAFNYTKGGKIMIKIAKKNPLMLLIIVQLCKRQ